MSAERVAGVHHGVPLAGAPAECARCGRVRELSRRAVRRRRRLCHDCLPRCEAALADWLALTLGAHDDVGDSRRR
jgi:hypothetical protein